MRFPDPKERFSVAVPEADLADLAERLERVRWPDQPQGRPWQYGASLGYMRKVADYWRHGYQWRNWEATLNRWPQFITDIDGQKIHFIIEQGSGDNPLPLLITHGWPGSVVEFIGIIDALAHPERHGGDMRDAFTVVAPSLPGYGFSPAPAAPIAPWEVARLWHRLMVDTLQCERYVAQGGDWGGIVTSWLALEYPQRLAAINLNIAAFRPNLGGGDSLFANDGESAAEPLDESERDYLRETKRRFAGESGYIVMQGTKSQTLAYGLTDSPIGLAAWILEKFQGWTVPGTDAEPPFPLDLLLTNVMLYWLNGINGANWLYHYVVDGRALHPPPGRRVEVPTGMLLCPGELGAPPPDRWIRRSYNLVDRVDLEQGGHFPALEQGPRFTRELREFFRAYRIGVGS